jgi:hypothetical protein
MGYRPSSRGAGGNRHVVTDMKSLLALRGVGPESGAESVRFHGRRVTKVARKSNRGSFWFAGRTRRLEGRGPLNKGCDRRTRALPDVLAGGERYNRLGVLVWEGVVESRITLSELLRPKTLARHAKPAREAYRETVMVRDGNWELVHPVTSGSLGEVARISRQSGREAGTAVGADCVLEFSPEMKEERRDSQSR